MSPTKGTMLIVGVGGGIVLSVWAIKSISSYFQERRERQYFQKKCQEWPKDTVIVHGMKRGKLAPHPSPFVLKLETFLRMHDIPYIFESEFPKGNKKKMPWITLNNEHYTDSGLIIKFLRKKYNLKPKGSYYNDREKAVAAMARVMIEEHFFWGLLLWRYVYANGEQLEEIFNMNTKQLKQFQQMTYAKYKEASWYQGLGRHNESEVIQLMKEDLKVISDCMGSKKFLLGDEPCDEDCALFGMLAQLVWNDLKSPFSKLIFDELPNLKEYCYRMKTLYWEDWDSLVGST